MSRRGARALAALLIAVAAGGHWAYWYAARPRASVPRLAETRALLGDPRRDAVLWVPFPHQNLGALDERVGDLRAWLALLAEAAGRPAPRLPRFGPWSAPPAREWVVALGPGDAVLARAEVYPLVAALARAAGRLASNPWLGGGEVRLGDRRRGRVAWHGRSWSLTSDDAPAVPPAGEPPAHGDLPTQPVLGLLRLRAAPAPLPDGLWRIRRSREGEVLVELGELAAPWLSAPPGEDPPAAWLAETSAGPIAGPSALLLWEGGGSIEGFPRALLLAGGVARPYRLPGAGIARLAGLEPVRRRQHGVERIGLDEASVAGAPGAESWLLDALPGPAAGSSWRAFAAGADPVRTRAAIARLAQHLERVPVLGQREGRRLRRAADLLAPWSGCGELTLEVWRDPDAARLRLCAPSASR